MSYVSVNYDSNPLAPMGKWAGDGECVTYVRIVIPNVPHSPQWKKGAKVRNNATIRAGMAIATFNASGHYDGHAAIYRAQDIHGIQVTDQWIKGHNPEPVHHRTIRWNNGHGSPVNDGDQFCVVE